MTHSRWFTKRPVWATQRSKDEAVAEVQGYVLALEDVVAILKLQGLNTDEDRLLNHIEGEIKTLVAKANKTLDMLEGHRS